MRRRSQQFRVGALVIGASVLFISMILFVLGSSLDAEEENFYILFRENVKGMVVGSKVNYQGIPVGAVSDIRFQDGATMVKLTIDPRKAEVQDVTYARLDRLLVTGQVTVELEGYSKDAKRLKSGASIQAVGNAMSELTTSIPEIVEHADAVLVEVHELLLKLNSILDTDNITHLDNLISQLDAATKTLPQSAELAITDLRQLLHDIGPAVRAAGATLSDVSRAADGIAVVASSADQFVQGEDFSVLVRNANVALNRLEEFENSAKILMDDARDVLARNDSPLRSALLSARDTMREVYTLARRLRMAPSSVIYGAETSEISIPAATPPRGKE